MKRRAPSRFRFVRSIAILFYFCLAGTLFADDNWSKKPYLEWTEEEALQVLTDSPWSRVWARPNPSRQESRRAGTALNENDDPWQHSTCCRTFGSGVSAAAADARNAKDGSTAQQPASSGDRQEWFRVVWFSSMHVRQALYRLRLINGVARDSTAETQLTQPVDKVVLALSGPSMRRFEGASLAQLRASTRLESRRNRERVANLQAFTAPEARPDRMALFVFERNIGDRRLFEAGDKELTFSSGEGADRITVNFKLEKMTVAGVLDY